MLIFTKLAEEEITWRTNLRSFYDVGLELACPTSPHILGAGPEPHDHNQVQVRSEHVVQLCAREDEQRGLRKS